MRTLNPTAEHPARAIDGAPRAREIRRANIARMGEPATKFKAGKQRMRGYRDLPPTKFKAELWTVVTNYNSLPPTSHELWAVVMLDGDDAGWPCAFGPKEKMEKFAEQLNASRGVWVA